MKLRRSLSLWASAALFTCAAAVLMSVTAPDANASALCQSYFGRICAKTEECTGALVRQCVSYYYYFGSSYE